MVYVLLDNPETLHDISQDRVIDYAGDLQGYIHSPFKFSSLTNLPEHWGPLGTWLIGALGSIPSDFGKQGSANKIYGTAKKF